MTSLQPPMAVYSARCSWWDVKDRAGSTPSGLPCCPHCQSVLFETPLDKWVEGAKTFVPDEGHPAHGLDYPALLTWMRGKCFPSVVAAIAAYRAIAPSVAAAPTVEVPSVDALRWSDTDMFEAWAAGAQWVIDRTEVVEDELYLPVDQPGIEGRDWCEAWGDWITNVYEFEDGES